MHQFPLLQGPDSDYPDLDPHGAAVQLGTSDGDLLLTSDFINPLSTVTANVHLPHRCSTRATLS